MNEDEVRGEFRHWLGHNWEPDLGLVEWRSRLVDSGWARPSWPEQCHGRGMEAWADSVVDDELQRAGAVGLPIGVGMGLAAPTLLAHGSPALQRRLLRPILTGEAVWCQLFSEPGSGSDLAGLTTRADVDGDEFVISGQKVWTTSAHHALRGLLLARPTGTYPSIEGSPATRYPWTSPA